MSRASSPSSGRRYGTARVCQLWEVPRSTVYARRARASRPAQPAAKRGPNGAATDAALTEQIRAVLARSPFIGEGYRKAWARLRLAGCQAIKSCIERLQKEFVSIRQQRPAGCVVAKELDEVLGSPQGTCGDIRGGCAREGLDELQDILRNVRIPRTFVGWDSRSLQTPRPSH